MLKREHPFPEDDRTIVGIPAPLHLPAGPLVADEPEDTVVTEIPWWAVRS